MTPNHGKYKILNELYLITILSFILKSICTFAVKRATFSDLVVLLFNLIKLIQLIIVLFEKKFRLLQVCWKINECLLCCVVDVRCDQTYHLLETQLLQCYFKLSVTIWLFFYCYYFYMYIFIDVYLGFKIASELRLP